MKEWVVLVNPLCEAVSQRNETCSMQQQQVLVVFHLLVWPSGEQHDPTERSILPEGLVPRSEVILSSDWLRARLHSTRKNSAARDGVAGFRAFFND